MATAQGRPLRSVHLDLYPLDKMCSLGSQQAAVRTAKEQAALVRHRHRHRHRHRCMLDSHAACGPRCSLPAADRVLYLLLMAGWQMSKCTPAQDSLRPVRWLHAAICGLHAPALQLQGGLQEAHSCRADGCLAVWFRKSCWQSCSVLQGGRTLRRVRLCLHLGARCTASPTAAHTSCRKALLDTLSGSCKPDSACW